MKNPNLQRAAMATPNRLRRARFLAGISAVAAAGTLSVSVQAAAPTFADHVKAVQSAQALAHARVDAGRDLTVFSTAKAAFPAGLAEFAVERIAQSGVPILSVGLVEHETTIIRGAEATFIGYSNYPAAHDRGEIRIFDAAASPDQPPHAVVAVSGNGAARWKPTPYAGRDMIYVYRVYDAQGNFDETAPQPIHIAVQGERLAAINVTRPKFGMIDAAAYRGINLSQTQTLAVSGRAADAAAILTIEDQIVPLDSDGNFTATVLQPTACDGLRLTVQLPCGARHEGLATQDTWNQAGTSPTLSPQTGKLPELPASGFEIRTDPTEAPAASDYSLEVRADALAAEPVMSIGLIGSERTVVLGSPVEFQTYTNYPSFVARGEVRIFAAGTVPDALPLAVVTTDVNGYGQWQPATDTPRELFFTFRVYDDRGNFDESQPHELTLVPETVTIESTRVMRPTFGMVDEARLRNIPMARSATITVSGLADPSDELVRVAGQIVPVNPDGKFITQQLVDRDSKDVRVTIERNGQTTFATSRDVSVPRSDWFFVAQGDLTFRSMSGSGPAVEVSGDPLADGNSITSRAAFYTKGAFGDGWRVTAALDTGETLLGDIFNNLDRKDPRQLLRRLGSNEFYPTYGDDSTLVEDAPTQGQFYLRVQKADTSLLVGNYIVDLQQAELAQLDRGLFGIAFDHKSSATTDFGERKTQFTAFASDPGTVPGRDEFRGTGGSLYFLNRQDLTVGSERIRVEVRDRDTGLVLETRDLRPQEDYDIDYFQGRVTLLRPLASTVANSGLVRESSAGGNVPVLVVRYEFTPPVGSLDGYTIGGRGSAWLGEKLRIGASAQRETTDTADQVLLGADALLRLTAGTYLKGEIAQTDGPGFGQNNSVDGGLLFTDVAAPGIAGRTARAWRLEGAANLAELQGKTGDRGTVSAFYESRDAGFAANSQLTPSDTILWGTALALPIGASTNITAKYETLDTAAAGERSVATFDLAQDFGKDVELKLGVRRDEQAPGLLFNSTENGIRTDAAVQLGYNPAGRNWSIYGFGQATLESDAARSRNNRIGVGGKAEISDKMSLSAEVSEGDGGLGADIQLSRRHGEGSETYIGYALLADRTNTGLDPVNLFTRSNAGTLTAGARHRFSSSFSVFGENRIGHGGIAPSTMRSLGMNFDPNEKLSFSATFENGQIDDAATGLFRRTAGTFGFGYTTDGVQFGSNIEARFERGAGRDQTVWLVRNTASVQISPDWRALGRLNFAIADNEGPSVRAADYVEGTIGVAYRPVLHDRLNVLARYNYFQDLGPLGQITAGGETGSPKQRSQIGVIDVNYDLTQSLTIGAKYGYRQGEVSLDRTSDVFISSNTHLGVLRLDWRPVNNWDLVVEGHHLSNDLAGDSRWGGLAAIYRHLGNNVKVGVGYSISDFSDDLTDQSYTSKGFFLNLLGKF
ncbi:MAG: hypothetical protein EDM03_08780 [Porphyrobacter sp. IPPAS B-1204]|nr:MAG: hypothetical protein EDM03_08780 [Porphyrobacter sp. IPPAS B-1204]